MQRLMGVAAAAVLCFGSHPAEAKIACSDGLQLVQGSWLVTPYCQDELVALVAQENGVNAPAVEIRENPNFQREVCRLIGHDIRIRDTCADANPNGRGRF
jgi:hypothetical protein